MEFQIGPWLVRPALNRVVRGSRSFHITPKSMDVLVCLAKRDGEVVSRDALFQEAWAGTHVSQDALTKCIGELRRVFQPARGETPVIETIAKRGYRMAAPVVWDSADTRDDGNSGARQQPSEEVEATPGQAAVPLPAAATPHGPGRGRLLAVGVAVLSTLAIVVAASTGRLGGWLGMGRDGVAVRSIAVLPLTDLSGDPEQAYFSEGITEELITELAQIDAWKVISRTSAMRYKASKQSLPEIARDLGVAGIVEGTVLRTGDRVRVTAQLIHAKTDTHLWSGSFESELRDVMASQRKIARAIARELRVRVDPHSRVQTSRRRPMVPGAYEEYLKGRYWLDRSDFGRAASHLEQATLKDPDFAVAHALLFEADSMRTFRLDLPLTPRAVRAMQTALALDDGLAEAHMNAGDEKFFGNWNWKEGESEYRRAMELDRGSVDAAAHLAGCLHVLGRWDEALEAYRRALELDPVSPRLNTQFLGLLVDSHKYEQAAEQFHKTIELGPNNPAAYIWAGQLYELQDRGPQATAAYIQADTSAGRSAGQIRSLQEAAGTGGVRAYWRRRLEMLQERSKRERVPPYDFATLYLHVGESDRAMDMLESAYQQRAPRLAGVRARAFWQRLRPHPRYQALLRRMNFPE
jgi:TolB-like protein/DNA-binding winged helix-turn-helix (wHTH) protein